MSANLASSDSFYVEINNACERFEAEWKAGREPQIEIYLEKAPEGARSELTRELLKLDIYYRRNRGDTIGPNDYTPRFREHASLIDTLLGPSLLPNLPIDTMQAGRYRLEKFIARGGMGEVWEAHDPEFRRRLAIKILREEYKDNPDMIARFLEEAHVTGQLQHPGVPPVHEIGRLADGRPFLAMKLIEGRTLADLLAERKAPSFGLPRFLTIFEQICQTVAYAHSRHVIHRDLKPLNIMVGAFGEVQVMDWGLAKALAPEDRKRTSSDEADRITLSPLDLDTVVGPTRAGQVMGTWAYMPPEQARGEVDKVDQRSDVFSLGATLCEILTGEPAYRGPTREKFREQAETADLADAFSRLDASGADAELIALAKRCLGSEMGLRPDNAGVVAKAVAGYKAEVQERLRKAELERAAAEVKALEGRKRLRVTLALAASLLALVILAGGATWWYQHEQFARKSERAIRKAQIESVVPAALSEFQSRLEEAKEQTNDPKLRLARARSALSALLRAEEQITMGEVSEELAERVRLARAGVEEEILDSELLVDLDRIRLEQADVTEGHFDHAKAVAGYAAAMRKYGLEVTAPEAAAARVQDSRQREALLAALEDWSRYANDDVRKQLHTVLQAAEPAPNTFRARWRAARRDRSALAELVQEKATMNLPAAEIVNLAVDLQVVGELAAMEQLLRGGQERFPNDFWLNHDLGMALVHMKPPQVEKGLPFLMAALALRSDSPVAYLDLGNALLAKQDREGAMRCFRAAFDLDPKFAPAHIGVGRVLMEKKDFEGAIDRYRTGIHLDSKSAVAHYNLGRALREVGRARRDNKALEEAFRCYRIALDLDPGFAPAQNGMGNALWDKNDPEGAIRCYRTAIDLDPKFAVAHYNLGRVLFSKNDIKGSIECYRTAIDLDPTYAEAHCGLGDALRATDDLDGAISCFRAAIKLDRKLAVAHYNLGNALNDKKDLKGAIECYHNAIDVAPDHAEAHCNLGHTLLFIGKFTEALAAFKRGDALGSRRKDWSYPSAEWVRQCARFVELDPKLPAFLKGNAHPSSALERLDLASLCQLPCKRLHAAAARIYAEAFAAELNLAENLQTWYRFRAACSAALAGAGQAADAADLADQERTRLRKQALDWLRADLDAWTKLADDSKERSRVRQALRHWQLDLDLAGIRDPAAVANLPPHEREACKKLWTHVAALLKKVSEKPPDNQAEKR
jgi:tetratricopeptide (TPR) repeat protein